MPMQYEYLGNSGVRVSRICLGTMTFGRETGEKDAHAQLDSFVKAGGNFIDTADVYGSPMGETERVVGKWLKKLPVEKRRDIVLATKVYFGGGRSDVNSTGLSRGHIMASVKESLGRLQTNYIDLLQIHNWDHETPPEVWLLTMKDLIAAGKVHMLGVCNVTGWQLQRIIDAGRDIGVPIVSAQLQYSLLARGIEWELMDCCEHNGVSILPWSALKGGWLSGKFKRGVVPTMADGRVGISEADPSKKSQAQPSYSQFASREDVWTLLDAMHGMAKQHGSSVSQVALRWVLQRPTIAAVIIGARTYEQFEDNMRAIDFALNDEQMLQLCKLSAVEIPYPYEMVWRAQRGDHGRLDEHAPPPGLWPRAKRSKY